MSEDDTENRMKWADMTARWMRLRAAGHAPGSPEMIKYDQAMNALIIDTPRAKLDAMFGPMSSPQDTADEHFHRAGQYFLRALTGIGAIAGGAYLGGKNKK